MMRNIFFDLPIVLILPNNHEHIGAKDFTRDSLIDRSSFDMFDIYISKKSEIFPFLITISLFTYASPKYKSGQSISFNGRFFFYLDKLQ